MKKTYRLGLKTAHKKSGFVMQDVADFLGCGKSTISRIENGLQLPSLTQLCALSVIYGKHLETAFDDLIEDIKADVAARLVGYELAPANGIDAERRAESFAALKTSLDQVHE